MRKLILGFAFLTVFLGCDKEKGDCMNIDYSFNIYAEDEQGRDLLDPEKEYSYKAEDIGVYGLMVDYQKQDITIEKNKELGRYFFRIGIGDVNTQIVWDYKGEKKDVDVVKTVGKIEEECFITYKDVVINGKNEGQIRANVFIKKAKK